MAEPVRYDGAANVVLGTREGTAYPDAPALPRQVVKGLPCTTDVKPQNTRAFACKEPPKAYKFAPPLDAWAQAGGLQ